MANIFDGIKQMSDDELRLQLAMFNSVNIGNAAKETGFKFMSGLADVANAFAESFGNKGLFDVEYKKVVDMVNDEYAKLQLITRGDLDKMVKDKLVLIIKSLSGKEIGADISMEYFSSIVVDIAADGYVINKYISPAHKIEEVSIKYRDAFLKNLQAGLMKLTEAQIKEYAKIIEKAINSVPMEVKRQVQELLMPSKFNGQGIISVLRKQKTTGKLGIMVELLGREAFKSVEADITTMYDAVKNLNRITRVQVARLVCVASEKYGKKFYAETDLLPSYIPVNEKEDRINKDKEFKTVVKQVEIYKEKKGDADKRLDNKNKQLEEAREAFEDASKEYDRIQAEFTQLESKKDDYINNRKPEAETKYYYGKVNDTKRELDRIAAGYEKKRKKLHELTAEIEECNKEVDEANEELTKVLEGAKAAITQRANGLKLKWSAFFFRFKFEDSVFEMLVCDFSLEELLFIEQMLKEAHDAKDLNAFIDADGKINAYIGGRKPAQISFSEGTVIKIER